MGQGRLDGGKQTNNHRIAAVLVSRFGGGELREGGKKKGTADEGGEGGKRKLESRRGCELEVAGAAGLDKAGPVAQPRHIQPDAVCGRASHCPLQHWNGSWSRSRSWSSQVRSWAWSWSSRPEWSRTAATAPPPTSSAAAATSSSTIVSLQFHRY